MENLDLVNQYVALVNDNVRKAYSFADGQEYYKTVGATVTKGKKYYKVIVNTGQNSVHAFIDEQMNVYKPAGCNAPAKGIRYNLITDIDKLIKILSIQSAYCGGYLYR